MRAKHVFCSGTLVVGAILALGCGEPAEPYRYLLYESRATGELRHEAGGDVETWEVGPESEGVPCTFTHELVADTGPFLISCDEFFRFSEGSRRVMLDGDQTLSSRPAIVDEIHVDVMMADLVITEAVGEINWQTHTIPANYLRRYTVTGELDCDADPELGCEGVWSFDLAGEQTRDDVAFRTGDPY